MSRKATPPLTAVLKQVVSHLLRSGSWKTVRKGERRGVVYKEPLGESKTSSSSSLVLTQVARVSHHKISGRGKKGCTLCRRRWDIPSHKAIQKLGHGLPWKQAPRLVCLLRHWNRTELWTLDNGIGDLAMQLWVWFAHKESHYRSALYHKNILFAPWIRTKTNVTKCFYWS